MPPRRSPPAPSPDVTLTLSGSAAAAAESREAAAAELREPAPSSPWERYEDLGVLGAGGMGEVHRVRDTILGRTLAMKLLPVRGAGAAGFRARFLAEARLAAGLAHPGIVPVHDCGATPDGGLWFTMDEVRGRSLGEVILAAHEDGLDPSALRRLAGVFLRVCEAVAHAHRSGVLHRDLKPENVMVGDLGEVLVVDWGLARALGGSAEEALPGGAAGGRRLTRTGHVIGTPAYMPPEQARGLVAEVDQRSDVYALGAVLYEILDGRAPYRGSARAVLARIVEGPPAPLSCRLAYGLPGELAAVCERAMARTSADRFPDAGALAAEVRSVLDGARRRDRALALVLEAQAIAPRTAELHARALALRADAAAVLGPLETFDPEDRKAPGWALEDEACALEVAAAVEEAASQNRLHAALAEVPDLAEAHAALADVHAEEAGRRRRRAIRRPPRAPRRCSGSTTAAGTRPCSAATAPSRW